MSPLHGILICRDLIRATFFVRVWLGPGSARGTRESILLPSSGEEFLVRLDLDHTTFNPFRAPLTQRAPLTCRGFGDCQRLTGPALERHHYPPTNSRLSHRRDATEVPPATLG